MYVCVRCETHTYIYTHMHAHTHTHNKHIFCKTNLRGTTTWFLPQHLPHLSLHTSFSPIFFFSFTCSSTHPLSRLLAFHLSTFPLHYYFSVGSKIDVLSRKMSSGCYSTSALLNLFPGLLLNRIMSSLPSPFRVFLSALLSLPSQASIFCFPPRANKACDSANTHRSPPCPSSPFVPSLSFSISFH